VIDVRSYDSLGELLRDACIQFKSNTALIEANRKREAARYSFLDFKRAAEPVAAMFAPTDRVAIVMSNQSKWLIAAYAAFYRGAVLVPIDFKLTGPEQVALIAHSGATVLVTEAALRSRFEDIGVRVLVAEAFSDLDPDGKAEFVPRQREDLATVVYSSGTGGTPKGCMLSHGAYLSQLDALLDRFPMEPGDRYFSILPTNHAIDFMCGFVGPFVCGATVVHQRTLRPEMILATMKRYEVTHMAVVPLVLTAFERAVKEKLDDLPDWKRWAVDALMATGLPTPVKSAFGGKLRMMFCGGAPTDRKLAEFFSDIGIPVVVGYGLTEACTVLTVNRLTPFRADSVGCPVDGVEIRIAGAGPGGIGEVQVRGPTLMDGYLDAPELTAETLVDGWLHTGDLGWLDASNHLHLVGRSKNMIVTAGGKNIYPEDIEGSFGGVGFEEMAIYATNYLWPAGDLEFGELVAVVRADDVDDARTAIRAQNRRLPDFKRVAGVVPWNDPFPRTASMKLKRNVLAESLRTLNRDAVEAL